MCPCYRDVASFVILRDRILDVFAHDQMVASSDIHFVVVDDTAGYDNDIDQLKGYSDVRVITPPSTWDTNEPWCSDCALHFQRYSTPI